MTIFDVKNKAIDALGEVDVSKLNMYDAKTFAETLKFLYEIREPDTTYTDAMNSLMEQIRKPYEPPTPKTLSDFA